MPIRFPASCLSFAGDAAIAMDDRFELEGEGFLAKAFCHEMDHLDGTLIIDHVSSLKRQFVKKEIRRLQRDGEW